MIFFSTGLLIVGTILAIIKKSLYPFIVVLIYGSVALLFDLFQFMLGFLGDNWVFHLVIPFIITAIALYIANRLIEKMDWQY
ncbi:hypothetical protein ABD90_16075 [Lysinibacillus fusiformis]|uniref:Uncharacterized protein n=2 Tax=Lysinibacillus sphaericus TaxID=1421 RepID=W7S5Z2_LYSSH|nr:hypothetical protein AR327_00290 [Lysinibacillus sphaericus]EWH35080.1 hypothetical protein P799_01010 [Lysinibacillus sphaericus CBAM5]MBG9726730.1 hypothetical protein [Lysinibacillus fusiformis]KZL47304.1 hypothetical protein A2J08_21945 [Lysinibacillus sphaericus]MBG9692800.1 hypothetical protein [Lysinibacillus sphaericus]